MEGNKETKQPKPPWTIHRHFLPYLVRQKMRGKDGIREKRIR